MRTPSGVAEEPIRAPTSARPDLHDPDEEGGVEPAFATLDELLRNPKLLEPPECVVPLLAYRSRLVMLAGPDKSGKSTLLSHAIAALTRGDGFLGGATSSKNGRAMLLGLEEAVGDQVRRLHTLEANPERVQLVIRPQTDLLERANALLSSWPADLVVIDSLQEYARVTEGTVPDDGDNAGWAGVVRPLVALARAHDTAVVVLHHVRRSDGQFRGAGEIAAAADALLELVVPDPGLEDPNVRHIRGRGRWQIEPFDVVLRNGCYELESWTEPLSVDARVLLKVDGTPGVSRAAVRREISGRASTVDAAINRLIKSGDVVDYGSSRHSKLHPATSGQVKIDGF